MALAAASGSNGGSGNGAPPGAPARQDEPSTEEEKKKQLITWLQSIDQRAPADDVLDKLASKLMTDGYESYKSMEGMERTDINAITEVRCEQCFLTRAVANLAQLRNIANTARPVFPPPPPSSNTAAALAPLLTGIVGGANAADLAKILNPTTQVDVQELLKNAKQTHLPTMWKGEHDLYSKLVTERKKGRAETPEKSIITYVDLVRDALPTHITAFMVGEALLEEDELQLPGNSMGGGLLQLTKEVRAVTKKKRFFRSVAQWQSALMVWGHVAVASEQITMENFMLYFLLLLKLQETLRGKNIHYLTIVVYDQLTREFWDKCTRRGDPEFSLAKELKDVNKDRFTLAIAQLPDRLITAGLNLDPNRARESDEAQADKKLASVQAKMLAASKAQEEKERRQLQQLGKIQQDFAGGYVSESGDNQGQDPWPPRRQKRPTLDFEKGKDSKGKGRGGKGKGGKQKGKGKGGYKGKTVLLPRQGSKGRPIGAINQSGRKRRKGW